jgi:hypothetical protein
VPATQLAHAVEPVEEAYFPPAQLRQAAALVADAYRPTTQPMQLDDADAPVEADAVPTAHAVQLVDPVDPA